MFSVLSLLLEDWSHRIHKGDDVLLISASSSDEQFRLVELISLVIQCLAVHAFVIPYHLHLIAEHFLLCSIVLCCASYTAINVIVIVKQSCLF